MNRIRKALLLSAGFGTRMHPLTSSLPKPLLPLWNKTLLDHNISLLSGWGVKELLINVHHGANEILDHVRSTSYEGVNINLSFENSIRGTGGAVKSAEWFLDTDQFWIMNADIAIDLSPAPILKSFDSRKHIAAVWLTDQDGPRTVQMSNGLVTSFHSQGKPENPGYTFCGLHLASTRVLKYISQDRFSSIIDAYTNAMKDKQRVAAVCIKKSFWADAGTFNGYISTHKDVLSRYKSGHPGSRLITEQEVKRIRKLKKQGVTVKGFAAIAEDAEISKGCRLTDSVILSKAKVKKNAAVYSAVVGPGTNVSSDVTRLVMPLLDTHDKDLIAAVESVGWPLQKTIASPLSPRGSLRRYVRVIHADKSAVFMHFNPDRAENSLYEPCSKHLAECGIRVPEIILSDRARCTLLLEDVGEVTLKDYIVSKNKQETLNIYRAVLRDMVRFHNCSKSLKQCKLSAPFSPSLYRWERNLFLEQFLARHMKPTTSITKGVNSELKAAARHLNQLPSVLLHRDLQSSNILIMKNRPVYIDFQGMRLGPAVYDLASLICDPYVNLDPEIQNELLKYYAIITGANIDNLMTDFLFGAAERLAQAIGAFALLGSHRETSEFMSHITPAIAGLKRLLNHNNNFSHLTDMCDMYISQEKEISNG